MRNERDTELDAIPFKWEKLPVMNHAGEADSRLKEVAPGIAFPLTACSELLKYLPSLLRTYIKVGKLLLQTYYSFTSKHCLPLLHLAALKDGFHRQFAAAIQAPCEQGTGWGITLGPLRQPCLVQAHSSQSLHLTKPTLLQGPV